MKKTKSKPRRKRHPFQIFCLSLCLLLGIGLVGLSAFGFYSFNLIETEELFLEKGETLVEDEVLAQTKDYNVKHIALFGVDARTDTYEGTRSDVLMILSLNEDTNEGFLTSVPRDTYAYLGETYGYQKINHAYAYGKEGLAIQALNRNFDLDITSYVTVNFNAVEGAINALGGIELIIESYEVDEINRVISEMNEYSTTGVSAYLKTSGAQTLNGKQAVAYMRIRKVGNGDFERMERQRTVIALVFEQLKSMEFSAIIPLMNQVLPSIKTNLTSGEILELGASVLMGGLSTLTQQQLPQTGLSVGTTLSDGLYYLVPTSLEDNVVAWHNLVYRREESYQLTSTTKTLNEIIQQRTGLY